MTILIFSCFVLKREFIILTLEVGKNYVLQNTETTKIKCYRFNYFNFCIIFLRTVLITTLKKILFENKITWTSLIILKKIQFKLVNCAHRSIKAKITNVTK